MKVLVLGNGDKIINQYPNRNSNINEGSLIVLKTNNNTNIMPNLLGYSYKEADIILKLMGVNYNLDGTGYVSEQSIQEGEVVTDNVNITLKNKY